MFACRYLNYLPIRKHWFCKPISKKQKHATVLIFGGIIGFVVIFTYNQNIISFEAFKQKSWVFKWKDVYCLRIAKAGFSKPLKM